MNHITSFSELVEKIKEFETNEDFLPFIKEGILDSESEDFYLKADSQLQIFIFELVFLLEKVFQSNNQDYIRDMVYNFNKSSYTILKLENQIHDYKIKTKFCDIVF